ncbi:major facilitator superfamily protein [Candidatus Omnitrophus magneticus]|uniref:Major facilitator superfamily protein n=1 Tax=Candidatus Omnitrophus magneticus TaxID=1609969 RepID=A0A0F0CLE8_9BACT|nr:major facilitator superfamily protein [Candidatus Omnitrophus magneticus]
MSIRDLKEKIRKSLRFSLFDGMAASIMAGLTQDYFVPFLLLLGGTAKHVGIINALPNLFASLFQFKTAELEEFLKSRRKTIVLFVLLQVLTIIPILFIVFKGAGHPVLFITFVICFTVFGALSTASWGSLMADIVPKNKRGEYFGWRNRILGFITVGSSLSAGIILNYMKKINIFHGFFIIFLTAFLARIISAYFLSRMYEPSVEYKKEHFFSFSQFLSRTHKSNFAKFVIFVALLNFTVNIASPFFAVFMLRDLHFNYLIFTIVTISAPITAHLSITRWGKHADHAGNLKIIRLTAPIVGIVPLWWLVSQNWVFLIFAQIFSGYVWAGFNLSTSNFIYDAVTPEKRTRCIAYFNVLNGIALSFGAILGGISAEHVKSILGYNLLTLFVISSILRLVVGIYMPLLLKEVRPVHHVTYSKLFFSVIGIKSIIGKN